MASLDSRSTIMMSLADPVKWFKVYNRETMADDGLPSVDKRRYDFK